ncbi:hypothetical protein JG688_00018641 [Phytophthora aleatoria]|uniref:Uncharacterized protein n=1 Tax=Phytophthora aleatoria TaxID=2496075 RepID=A0A8J5MAY8_9STRA|nr:hypothetical protein JG688_00018641 [Phytophthora aleatoria]
MEHTSPEPKGTLKDESHHSAGGATWGANAAPDHDKSAPKSDPEIGGEADQPPDDEMVEEMDDNSSVESEVKAEEEVERAQEVRRDHEAPLAEVHSTQEMKQEHGQRNSANEAAPFEPIIDQEERGRGHDRSDSATTRPLHSNAAKQAVRSVSPKRGVPEEWNRESGECGDEISRSPTKTRCLREENGARGEHAGEAEEEDRSTKKPMQQFMYK